jgi:hypothetical protein
MDLSELAKRIEAAAVAAIAASTPAPPRGSAPIAFTTDHFGDEGWELVWTTIHALREARPDVFAQGTELSLALLVIDELKAQPDLDFEGLTEAIRRHVEAQGPRVVCTPLCNVAFNQAAVRLSDDVALVRALPNRHSNDSDEDIAADFNVAEWFGVRMSRTLREVEIGQHVFDTTRTGALLTIETGTTAHALARSRARAQYAVAMWTVLAPPREHMLLPDLGGWVPQPWMHTRQRHRQVLDPPPKLGMGPSEEGGDSREFGPYALPDDATLRLPFDAMSRLDRRGPQAVLSASLQLLAASRASRLQPSERVRALLAAVESLSEPASGGSARTRFTLLAQRHGTDALPARGWDQRRIQEAIRRVTDARNIATHGVDAVLLDLGYPIAVRRRLRFHEALGVELASGSLQADLPILVHVVGRTLAATIRELARDRWSDEAFEGYFQS